MKTYLIAHTDAQGLNCAQAKIGARTVAKARKRFAERYPQREIIALGVAGQGEW